MNNFLSLSFFIFSVMYAVPYLFLVNNFEFRAFFIVVAAFFLINVCFLYKGVFRFNYSELLFFAVFIIVSIVSCFYSGNKIALVYLIPLVGLYFFQKTDLQSVFKSEEYLLNKGLSRLVMLIFVIVVCISFLFFEYTHGKRMSIKWITDPNYTALILMAPLLLLVSVLKNNFKGFWLRIILHLLVFSLLIYIYYLTKSRAFFLSVLIFYSLFLIKDWLPPKLFRMLLFAAVLAPFVLQLFISTYLIEYFGQSHAGSPRIINITDTSNLARMNAFISAFNYSLSSDFLYSGIGLIDYMLSNSLATHIPHNWLLMMVLNSGWLFAFLYIIVLLFILRDIDLTFAPYLISALFFGSVLGDAVLIFQLFMLIIFSYWYRAIKIL